MPQPNEEAAHTSPSNASASPPSGEVHWEQELADLLATLSDTQSELLKLLGEKRVMLSTADATGLPEIQAREEALLEALRACHERRTALLQHAASEGLPSGSIVSLSNALSTDHQEKLRGTINDAQLRSRLLQHHSLTNWVIVQRTLLHLSQMLEIIATGGRPVPTYERDGVVRASGSLVDRAA